MTETDGGVFDSMDHKREITLIFNHERFSWHFILPERWGTSADRDNLIRRFSELGFEVSTSNHVDGDCFLSVFLIHGEGNHSYAYDAKIEIHTLTGLFKGDKCQSLVGKPKIFITLACQGNQHDVPVVPPDVVDHHTDMQDNVDAASVYTVSAGADFLMCYSVDLCEMLARYSSSLEFSELLTLVNRKVSQCCVDFCKDPGAIGKKQICFASMLTKKLHLCPKSSK
uniref:Caspase-6 n=1 Tax=Cricetulus griseus TaxID=10029 RepID=A0A8C2M211_CRIGR